MADPIIVTPGQIVAPPDWQSLYEQHGGIKSSTPIPLNDPKVQQMIAANPDLAATLTQHPIYRYYMADGSYVEAYNQENGEDVQITGYQPSQRFQQEHPANTPSRDPSSPQNKDAAELQRQREKNAALPPEQDPAYETDKERRDRSDARIKEQGAAAKADDTTVVSVEYAGTGKSRKKVTTYKSGRKATEDAPTNATPTGVTYDKDGTKVTKYDDGTETREQVKPDPHTTAGPVASGPAMPEIVVGSTSQAIMAYQQALMRDPSLTPAQREAYLNQFIETAKIATNEAAALQRQQESNLNASINLATGKQTALQNGMTAAVNFANSFVGKLPADSHLAGQAYGAMMLMNIINMQHSGLEGIAMPGAPQKPTPQPATIVSPGNPQAVSAQLEAAKQAGAANAAARSAVAASPALNQGQDLSTPAAAAATTPARSPVAVDPRSIGAPEAPSAAAMNTGQPGDPAYSPQPVPSAYDPNDPNAASEMGQPGDPGYGETYMKPAAGTSPAATDTADLMQPGPHPLQSPAPDYGQPGLRVLPQPENQTPVDVPYPSNAGAESMMPPGSDFAVLGQYQQPRRQQQAPADIGQPLAVLKAQASSTPPWRLNDQQIQQMIDAGVPEEEIYRVPGRSAA